MAKTVDLNTVDQVSPNSDTKILVENGSGDFGYISKIFNEDGGLAGVPNLETFETKEEANSTFATKTDAATKQQLNDYIKILIESEGNVAYMNNEANGGLIKFTSKDKKMSKVTLYDGTDPAHTYLQLVVKDEAENGTQVAKINGTLGGFHYIKVADNTPTTTNEIATLGDVYTRTLQEIALPNGDKAKIQNQNDGGVMQYVTSGGANNAVCVNNATGENNVGVELCALAAGGHGARIILNDHGAYLTIKDDATFTGDDAIVTKKELTALTTQIEALKAENASLKASLTEATETVNAYTNQVSQLVAASAAVAAQATVSETAQAETPAADTAGTKSKEKAES